MRRTFNRLPTLAALTIALTLLLAGCGADENSSPAVVPGATETAGSASSLEPIINAKATNTREPEATASPTATAAPVQQATATPTQPPTPDPTPHPAAGVPTQRQVETPLSIRIPAIAVETTVEWVGLDAEGNMDVPSGYDTTAWFQHGARPGMIGNAVIAGHLDSRAGPAVFFELDKLQPGDEIEVTTSDGERLTFRVDRIASFDAESAPRYEIFGPSTQPRLNLITCNGVFDPAAGAYNERLVVYSSLVSGSGG